ncbi:RHS repeat-associated core domain-containing protein [Flammeovirgaceae bacterium SG7u.111]|nr:RHS repeat-associated core domain-containing protein [Flammeovirgaceae bacterium SG7u.132]WPO33426.1 RHS repeat-associated core domain-containing protein [Flammeovirgaceae bacterium SG7u.111]
MANGQLWDDHAHANDLAGNVGLYNGNIAWMATDLPQLGRKEDGSTRPDKALQAMHYGYDQLNRISFARSSAFDGTAWANRTPDVQKAYDSHYTYDGNGNIEQLGRNQELDREVILITYNYMDGSYMEKEENQGYRFTTNYLEGSNRLAHVEDNEEVEALPPGGDANGDITYDYTPLPQTQEENYNNITLTDGARVQEGEDITLTAKESFKIEPGFVVEPGGEFSAKLGELKTLSTRLGQEEGNYAYDAIGNLIRDDSENITDIDWTIQGKVAKVSKTVEGAEKSVQYRYAPDGNRAVKQLWEGDNIVATDYYVRDASGNVMAIYKKKGEEEITLKERPIYGSSRLGALNGGEHAEDADMTMGERTWGLRQFELSNHLGNVLATVTDLKKTDGFADVASVSDYHPFGMQMPGRGYTKGEDIGYRYGFNNKENDPDLGKGIVDFGARGYNSKIGKWLSPDKVVKSFVSPYQFGQNSPIWNIDPDGNDEVHFYEKFDGSFVPVIVFTDDDDIKFFVHEATWWSRQKNNWIPVDEEYNDQFEIQNNLWNALGWTKYDPNWLAREINGSTEIEGYLAIRAFEGNEKAQFWQGMARNQNIEERIEALIAIGDILVGGREAIRGAAGRRMVAPRSLGAAAKEGSMIPLADDVVPMYRAPRKGTVDNIMKNGFDTGAREIHFAKERELALEYSRQGTYDDYLIRVDIPKATWDDWVEKKYIEPYEGGRFQIRLPNKELDKLNTFYKEKEIGY